MNVFRWTRLVSCVTGCHSGEVGIGWSTWHFWLQSLVCHLIPWVWLVISLPLSWMVNFHHWVGLWKNVVQDTNVTLKVLLVQPEVGLAGLFCVENSGQWVDWWAFFNVFHGRINRWTLKFHIEILFSGVQRRLKSKSHLSFCFYFKWTFSDSIGYLAEVPPCCCLVPILPCLKETWLVTRRAPDDETLNSACDQVMWLPVEQLKWMTFWQDGYKTFDLSLLSKMRRAVAWQKFWGEQIWDDWKLLRQQL